MRTLRMIFVAAAILAASISAQAGMLFEPLVGYEVGKLVVTDTGGLPAKSATTTGLGFGARLGYRFTLAWLALDGFTNSGKEKDALGLVADSDFSQTSLGLSVGVDLPVALRFYGGYGLSQEYKSRYSDGTDEKYTGGYTKVGVGFKMIPKVNLNLEYKMNTYTKFTNTTGSEVDASTVTSKIEHTPLFLSLGFSF